MVGVGRYIGTGGAAGGTGALAGGIAITQTSRLWGAEGNIVLNARDHCQSRIDLLAGFRYLRFEERPLAVLTFSAVWLYTNATAFSPTDTLPLRPWAKLMMMGQSAISLAVGLFIIARAINILD